MPKMTSQNNSAIYWLPIVGLPTPGAPTAAQLNAGSNISAAIVTGYTLGATASDTDDSKTIVDEGNVATPTFGNYEANISIFRDGVGDTPTVFTTAYNLFRTAWVEGYLVSRYGKKSTDPFVAGDVISVYRVINDTLRDVESDAGGPIQATIPFLPQGQMYVNITVV